MLELVAPQSDVVLHIGDVVKLNRFEDERWAVNCGWFSFGGNRPMNGWYVTSLDQPNRIKPITLPDIDDIYVIDMLR